MDYFEIIMLLCFGAAWPVSILKSYKSTINGSKSIWFLIIILIGYLNGILYKLSQPPANVIYLYIINAIMVSIDISLYIRNAYFVPKLSPSEKKLHNEHFNKIPENIFRNLLKLANYETLSAEETLIKQNTMPNNIFYILNGNVNIEKNGSVINKLGEKNFCGEMSFITDELTTADVITTTATKLLVWNKSQLTKHKDILNYFNMYLSMDLINKVKSTESFKQLADRKVGG